MKLQLLSVLFFFNYYLVFGQELISGKIIDNLDHPLIGVSICQNGTELCTFSSINGEFYLLLDENYDKVIVAFIAGYNPVLIGSINSDVDLIIRMEEENIDSLNTNKNLVDFIPLTMSYAWDFKSIKFNQFENELGIENVKLLNRAILNNSVGISIAPNKIKYGLRIGWKTFKSENIDSLQLKVKSSFLELNIGYKLINSRRFNIEPLIAVKWYRYRLINNNIYRKTSLIQHLNERDLDLRINQVVGFFGGDLSYNFKNSSFTFNQDISFGFYCGYIFKLNRRPWVYSSQNRITTDNKTILKNLNIGMHLTWMF